MDKKCSVPGCIRKYLAKEYCSAHYQQMARLGTIIPARPCLAKCTTASCQRPPKTKGYCTACYVKSRRKKCLEETCLSLEQLKGYCKRHYRIIILGVGPKQKKIRIKSTKCNDQLCSVPNCENSEKAKGLCNMHYLRLRNHGDTGTNYRRKYRAKVISIDNIMRPEARFHYTNQERDILREMFGENVSVHELENAGII